MIGAIDLLLGKPPEGKLDVGEGDGAKRHAAVGHAAFESDLTGKFRIPSSGGTCRGSVETIGDATVLVLRTFARVAPRAGSNRLG